MATYEIIYDYCSEDESESFGCTEKFEGSWLELQVYIKDMRREGCYNITAECVSDPDEQEQIPTVDQRHFLLPDILAANM